MIVFIGNKAKIQLPIPRPSDYYCQSDFCQVYVVCLGDFVLSYSILTTHTMNKHCSFLKLQMKVCYKYPAPLPADVIVGAGVRCEHTSTRRGSLNSRRGN